MFARIKRFYDNGLWKKWQVWDVVGVRDGITQEQYKQITGETYDSNNRPPVE